jgi:hypothetical protein
MTEPTGPIETEVTLDVAPVAEEKPVEVKPKKSRKPKEPEDEQVVVLGALDPTGPIEGEYFPPDEPEHRKPKVDYVEAETDHQIYIPLNYPSLHSLGEEKYAEPVINGYKYGPYRAGKIISVDKAVFDALPQFHVGNL